MIILLGLAGSGKGTQGQLLAKNLDYHYFSTGDFLRTSLTSAKKKEMLSGKLINDQEIIRIVDDYLNSIKSKNKSIIDGFPRTKIQADWLMQQHKKKFINIEAVIYINVDEEELIKRLIIRGRQDDTEQAIKIRFSEYRTSTLPIIENYKKNNIRVIEVDGSGSIEAIQENILNSLLKEK